jgi:hypothetical protein
MSAKAGQKDRKLAKAREKPAGNPEAGEKI